MGLTQAPRGNAVPISKTSEVFLSICIIPYWQAFTREDGWKNRLIPYQFWAMRTWKQDCVMTLWALKTFAFMVPFLQLKKIKNYVLGLSSYVDDYNPGWIHYYALLFLDSYFSSDLKEIKHFMDPWKCHRLQALCLFCLLDKLALTTGNSSGQRRNYRQSGPKVPDWNVLPLGDNRRKILLQKRGK